MKRSADLAIVCITVLMAIFMFRTPVAQPPETAPPVTVQAAAAPSLDMALLSEVLLAQSKPDATPPAAGRSEAWAGRQVHTHPVSRPVLTDELIETCLEVARDIDSGLADKLIMLRDRDSKEFSRKLRNSRRLVDLAVLKQSDDTLYQLKLFELRTDANVSRIALDYCLARRNGQQQRLPGLKQKLHKEVIFQVGAGLRARADYICGLEELVLRLETDLKGQQDVFTSLVADRMNLLLNCAQARAGVPAGGESPAEQRKNPVIPAE